MVYHSASDMRLRTMTFPFDDGTNPTYFIPVSTDDIINESDGDGQSLTNVLNYILSKPIGSADVIVDSQTDERLDALLTDIETAIEVITDVQIDALFA